VPYWLPKPSNVQELAVSVADKAVDHAHVARGYIGIETLTAIGAWS